MPHRWNSCAELRRTQIESGTDITFNQVFKPLFKEKVSALKKQSILEVGAGTGHLSKALSNDGYDITAIEPSPGMFAVAKEVLLGTEVRLLNCAIAEIPIGEKRDRYELAISHLVAHVVDDLLIFLKSVSRHVRRAGHFLFSVPHPCFYNRYKEIFGTDYRYMEPKLKEISFTITKDKENIISGVPYHHRPLSAYINALVDAGFAIDGFEETWPSQEIQEAYGKAWEYPRYCLFVCVKQ